MSVWPFWGQDSPGQREGGSQSQQGSSEALRSSFRESHKHSWTGLSPLWWTSRAGQSIPAGWLGEGQRDREALHSDSQPGQGALSRGPFGSAPPQAWVLMFCWPNVLAPLPDHLQDTVQLRSVQTTLCPKVLLPENWAGLLMGVKPIGTTKPKIRRRKDGRIFFTCSKLGEHWGSFPKQCLPNSKIEEVLS